MSIADFFKRFKRKPTPPKKRVVSHTPAKQYDIKNNLMRVNGVNVPKVTSSRSKYSSGNNICDYLVYHYTASTTAKSSHNTFKNPDTNVSWHLTIDTDGKVYQLYDFRKRTWHAGRSAWKRPNGQKITGLNKWAIGIEIINAGPLSKVNGVYKTWFGQVIDPSMVHIDKHGKPWHKYTDAQIATIHQITPVICKQYKCVDILSHEMISPGRKFDTGPAFQSTLDVLRKSLRNGQYS